MCIRAIQIIRDILRRGRGQKYVTQTFFASQNTVYSGSWKLKSCLKARLGFIRNFLTCSYHISKQMSHGVGGGLGFQNDVKKCHVLFEWAVT